jgi:Transcription factor WhiB
MKVDIIKYSWQKDGLCKKELKFIPETKEHVPYTYDDFYPPTGKALAEGTQEMCDRCPVQYECLEHALLHEKYGYWGGKSERQRIKIRAKRGIKCHAPQTNSWVDPWTHPTNK